MISPRPALATILALSFLSAVAIRAADTDLPLQNPGFEDGLNGWTLEATDPSVAQVMPEAASIGNKGLRLQSSPTCQAFKLSSAPLPVTVGKSYSVTYWFGAGGDHPGGGVNVSMVFKGADGKEIKPGLANIRKFPAGGISGGRFVSQFQLAAAAPEGATTFQVVVAAAKAQPFGTVDLDDFKAVELPDAQPAPEASAPATEAATAPAPADGAATNAAPAAAPKPAGVFHPVPPTAPERIAFLLQEINSNPYRGKSPPKIVIKLDDLKPVKGDGVHPRWQKIVDYAKEKNFKVNFGIIVDGMEMDCPKFSKWCDDLNASGLVEFWCHGYDHVQTGKVCEFLGQPLEYQKDHLDKCQALAKQKLGFPFVSFGAPFNATDASTVTVLEGEPDIKVWMYGDAKNPAGKVVLERCGVNLENPTLIANYGAFLENYAHNRGGEYFCMQGHPAGWGDDRYAEFQKIIEFLLTQKADFVHPRDFAPGAAALQSQNSTASTQ